MFTVLIIVLGISINVAVARPNNVPTSGASSADAPKDKSAIPSQDNEIVHGSILNIASDNTQFIIPTVASSSDRSIANTKSSANDEKLVRGKRFLNNVIGSALQSVPSGGYSNNWQECGRTHTRTVYTNGIGLACFGSCPQHVRCGYGNGFDEYFGSDGIDRIGYQGRVDFGRITLG